MYFGNFSELATATFWLSSLPVNFLSGISRRRIPIRSESSWDEEKTDILERASWLCGKVIVDPKKLLSKMPSALGSLYCGEWAVYSCSHLVVALANISRLYPDEKPYCLERIEKVIEVALSPEIRAYDTDSWGEDALETLNGKKSHLTYLSILAWMISEYKLAGGPGTRFDELLQACCEALARRMLLSRDLNLISFPRSPVFIPDMMFAMVALSNFSKLSGGKYEDLVDRWLEKAENEWIHESTGLLDSFLYRKSSYSPVRGSFTALNCYCLTLLDEEFAREQYSAMKRALRKCVSITGTEVHGIKEYLKKSPKFSFDVNAGPIVYGLSPSGTAWAIGSATYFQDWEFRSQLLRTGELAGNTVKGRGKRHYRLSDLALVGEAVVLAMRTNVPRH